MRDKKPHVVVFFGGDSANRDLSVETGHWVCHYLPRDAYEVTPVHVTADGKWQVPQGSLPRQGPIKRMLSALTQTLKPLSPADGLQRLLARPTGAFLSVLRGKGGDDGAMHSLGSSLKIPVIGSDVRACQLTYDKHLCGQHLHDIAPVPRQEYYRAGTPADEITQDVRDRFVPPLFVKPIHHDGSVGLEYVEDLDGLAAATKRVATIDEVLVQQQVSGTELTISLIENDNGSLTALAPTIIVPQHTAYYDSLAKRRPGRVVLHTKDQRGNKLVARAEEIARAAFEHLGCRGYASFDMIADGSSVTVLDVNTVPVISGATPLAAQLRESHLHPSHFLHTLVRRSFSEAY